MNVDWDRFDYDQAYASKIHRQWSDEHKRGLEWELENLEEFYGPLNLSVTEMETLRSRRRRELADHAITNDAVCHALDAIQPSTLRGTCERMG